MSSLRDFSYCQFPLCHQSETFSNFSLLLVGREVEPVHLHFIFAKLLLGTIMVLLDDILGLFRLTMALDISVYFRSFLGLV